MNDNRSSSLIRKFVLAVSLIEAKAPAKCASGDPSLRGVKMGDVMLRLQDTNYVIVVVCAKRSYASRILPSVGSVPVAQPGKTSQLRASAKVFVRFAELVMKSARFSRVRLRGLPALTAISCFDFRGAFDHYVAGQKNEKRYARKLPTRLKTQNLSWVKH